MNRWTATFAAFCFVLALAACKTTAGTTAGGTTAGGTTVNAAAAA